jgi:SnoaL-like domain
MDEIEISDWVEQAKITRVLTAYARGVDRIDVPLIKSCFWPDATDRHGTFDGNAHDFADYLGTALRAYKTSMHALTNIQIDVDGDKARSESYVTGHHIVERDGKDRKFSLGARYLDRLERRGGQWKISSRLLVLEWTDVPDDLDDIAAHLSKITTRGAPAPDDPWHKNAP